MNKLTWMLLSCLIVVLMVLSACNGTTPETTTPTSTPGTTTPTTTATTAPTTAQPTTAQPTTNPEKPKYGGTLTLVQAANITVFDVAAQSGTTAANATAYLTNENLCGGNWAKGPSGSGEFELKWGWEGFDSVTGILADSWEIPEIGVYKFHLRQGVTWALNPASDASKLVNGRAITVDDIVANFKRYMATALSPQRRSEPSMSAAATITKDDATHFTIRAPVSPWSAYVLITQGSCNVYPADAVQKYGDMTNWRNSVGTGPFILTDFVNSASATMSRNPNYWATNPYGSGKGDQLPYVETLKILVVPDVSTRIAAMRTGKTDWIEGVTWSDAASLQKTNPELLYNKYIGSPMVIGMRTDKQDLPYKNKLVRQALMTAVDYKSIVANIYGGNAEILGWPMQPIKAYKDLYIPLDQQKPEVQSLYSGNIDKAKKLLADAGYAGGFDAKIVVQNVPEFIDMMSAIKSMWAKIGVNLDIQVKEQAVYASIRGVRAHEEMLLSPSPYAMDRYANYLDIRAGATLWNVSYINDPVIEAANNESQTKIFSDLPRVYEIYKGLVPYILEQAYVVPMPAVYSYAFWQPRLKNYHGELMINQGGNADNTWATWVWVDQTMKLK